MRKLSYRETRVSVCSEMRQNTETKVWISKNSPASMNFLFPNTTNNVRKCKLKLKKLFLSLKTVEKKTCLILNPCQKAINYKL